METIWTILPDGRHEVTVITPWELIETEYRDIRRRYAAVPIRGFRAGKVPVATIDSLFGEQILADLIAGCSRRLCRKAMGDKCVEAGSPVEVSDGELRAGEWLRFKAVFVEMPRFDLPDYVQLGIAATDRDAVIDEIAEKLLDLTDFEPHPWLVERELEYDDSDDSAAATQRVKLMLILKTIAARDGIEVDDSDIQKRIELLAAENDVPPQQLRQYLASGGGLSRLSDALLAESVFDYLSEIQHK